MQGIVFPFMPAGGNLGCVQGCVQGCSLGLNLGLTPGLTPNQAQTGGALLLAGETPRRWASR